MAFDRMQSYGPSKLGINTVAAQRAADVHDRAGKNYIQEQKRTERLGRRAYRAAARGKDPSNYMRGIEALERMRVINGTSGAGIKMAGVQAATNEKRFQQTREKIDAFGNKTVDEQGRLAPKPQSRLLGEQQSQTGVNQNINEPLMVNGREALFADTGDGVMAAAVAHRDATYGQPSQSIHMFPQQGNEINGAADSRTGERTFYAEDRASLSARDPGLAADLGRLRAKWANEDHARIQSNYESREGTPTQQAAALRPAPTAPAAPVPASDLLTRALAAREASRAAASGLVQNVPITPEMRDLAERQDGAEWAPVLDRLNKIRLDARDANAETDRRYQAHRQTTAEYWLDVGRKEDKAARSNTGVAVRAGFKPLTTGEKYNLTPPRMDLSKPASPTVSEAHINRLDNYANEYLKLARSRYEKSGTRFGRDGKTSLPPDLSLRARVQADQKPKKKAKKTRGPN